MDLNELLKMVFKIDLTFLNKHGLTFNVSNYNLYYNISDYGHYVIFIYT